MQRRSRVTPGEWLRSERRGVVGVDFETYYTSSYSVSELGNWAYCHDRRFEAWAVSVSDGQATCVCEPGAFPWSTIAGLDWVSHNREFDEAVFNRLVELGIIGGSAEPPRPTQWHCSAALCAYLQLPRDLAGAVREVFGIELSKEVRRAMKGKRGRIDEPDPSGENREAEYVAKDAEMALALWNELQDQWPVHERRLYELTVAMGRRGLAMDWKYIATNIEELNATVKAVGASLPWHPPLSIPKFELACGEIGVKPPPSTAVTDPEYGDWLKANIMSEAATWVRHMQRIRSANRTAKVLEGMEARRMPNTSEQSAEARRWDRMAFDLKYFGASTGRWSGGGGLNMQNFNRKPAEGVDLRRCIVAPPGKLLAAVDYSQIESRVLRYLAGDDATLALYRSNPKADAYEIHARATMGYGEAEPLKDYCERTGSNIRQVAKARELGLGFQCGVDRFIEAARVLAGLEITRNESERIVGEFRESNPRVVSLWQRLNDACEACDGGEYRLPLPCTQVNPGLKRFLMYRDVRRIRRGSRDGNPRYELECTVGGDRIKVYGGLLAENWTQATARDVMSSAWLRCAAAGHVPVLSVHDELLFEVDEVTAEAELAAIIAIMERPVQWAPALPLRAAGKLLKVYGK